MSSPLAPLDQIRAEILSHDSFLIAAHVGPDGDAIGSGLALKMALEALGKRVVVVSTDGVPSSCRFLPGWDDVASSPGKQVDCAIILDCDGTRDRVAAPYAFIQGAKRRILIDHHRSSEPIFDVNWIDVHQPATAQMLYELIRFLEVPLSFAIAQCLLCGLSTDTGNFRFPNTTPECLRAAADLVEHGAESALIAFKLFDERSLESTKLLGLALQKMKSESGGKLMWTALTQHDFASTRVGDEGSENVVNMLRSVRGARMAVVLRERLDETGPVARISVRAEPELRADLFCARFGGGGHAAAAGCRIRYQPFDQSIAQIVEAARDWLESPPLNQAALNGFDVDDNVLRDNSMTTESIEEKSKLKTSDSGR